MKKNNLHKNKAGFSTPENYFEDFEIKLLDGFYVEKNIVQKTAKASKNGFIVPVDYFNTLEETILLKTKQRKPIVRVIPLFTKVNLISFSSIAAILAIILFTVIPSESKIDFSSIAITEIQEYINSDYIDLEDIEIINLLHESYDSNEILEENTLSDEIVINYLNEEGLENSLLLTE